MVYIKEEGRQIVANLILIRITYVLFSLLLHAVYSAENLIDRWVGFFLHPVNIYPITWKYIVYDYFFLFQGLNKQVVNDYTSA